MRAGLRVREREGEREGGREREREREHANVCGNECARGSNWVRVVVHNTRGCAPIVG